MLDLESLMDDDGKRYLKGIPRLDGGVHGDGPGFHLDVRGHLHTALGCGIAFLPIIPSAFAIWAFLRYFRGLDALQRRIQLEAVAFSFLATCLITLTWAFQQKAGIPAL
jgi:hypothetical protein